MSTFTANPPAPDLARLIDRHGATRVLATLMAIVWNRRRRRRAAEDLPVHLRADIGLPPREQQPVMPSCSMLPPRV